MSGRWEAVIGLEVHVQLATATKMFCRDRAVFGAEPNSHVCPVCLGLPGALPVPNARAVELGARAALALGCTVHPVSIFARKNYFYPDLPKGYQITQFERPLATAGLLAAPADEGEEERPVRIRRIHLEEDAGKSLHDRLAGRTAVDLNRAGVPLVEIVTEPDLESPARARAWLGRLKQVLEYVEVSDCDMEKGSLRVDANVSLRPRGSSALGTKTEVKNMNSFANVERALAYEVERQTALLDAGGSVVHETLLWDAGRGEARAMRGKEESHDYRYFPEPDLPPLVLAPETAARVAAELPELPAARRARLRESYGLPAYDAEVLTATRALADFYEAVVAEAGDAKAASNWTMTEVLGWANQHPAGLSAFPVPPAWVGELVRMVGDGTLSGSAGKRVFQAMLDERERPGPIVAREGLAQVRDSEQLEGWVREVVAAHPEEADRYRSGEEKLMGFLMGQVMKRSAGRADPRQASELLARHLRAG
ncbi:MAG TPA: Asp-tRNA(Asn)/Glu-tRNA(Gln) amidotransferase subunit GatB [Longimicrobiales bacterium]|nr:Asp-tRNA(Asn)/Glu-tRNA(Gln) amidotransferase subunit GatB [Longimicrobiales bacterium]